MLDAKHTPRDSRSFAKPAEGSALPRLLSLVPLFALVGCIAPGDDEVAVSETAQAATVSTYVSSSCSTAVVLGLSKQISDEISCLDSTLLRRFEPTTRLQLTSNAVLPYLGAKAKMDLEAVAATKTVQINSAFRTVVQQYLLYRWYQQGRCGIAAAATPGRSNHESGRAVDLSNYSTMISAMSARGWAHDVPGDAVHFDHLSTADIRGKDVLAFQRLWNRNNPGDKISEDGSYGAQTEARIKAAPATGFAKGATCATMAAAFVADVLSVDGPDRVLPQSRAHYAITLQNNSEVDWPGTAVLQVTSGTTQLRDASWISATQIALLGSPIPAHEAGEISFDVMTPNVTAETPIFEQIGLMAGSQQLGTVNIALTVQPDMMEPTSSDADDLYDSELSGGCSAGGGSANALVIGLALLALVRCRRR